VDGSSKEEGQEEKESKCEERKGQEGSEEKEKSASEEGQEKSREEEKKIALAKHADTPQSGGMLR